MVKFEVIRSRNITLKKYSNSYFKHSYNVYFIIILDRYLNSKLRAIK
jgi:hypothetical protein